MSQGNFQIGRPVAPVTGSAQVVLPRSGQLLGFFAAVAGTIALYDAASASGLPTAFLTVTVPAIGWYPCPFDLINGLVANCGAATTFSVA